MTPALWHVPPACGFSWVHPGSLRRTGDHAGLNGRSPSCRPRLHDFRHSFAVRAMLDAYHHDGDPAARLRHLSTWLGHTGPANTFWYLHAAPELLTLAADRLPFHWAGGTTP